MRNEIALTDRRLAGEKPTRIDTTSRIGDQIGRSGDEEAIASRIEPSTMPMKKKNRK